MIKISRLAIANLLTGLLLASTQANAARGEQSFSHYMAASKVQNQHGYTYRYQKRLGDKPAYQYRKPTTPSSANSGAGTKLKSKSNR